MQLIEPEAFLEKTEREEGLRMRVEFIPSNKEFVPAKVGDERSLIQTSWRQADTAIGHLRMLGVNNGRYDSKHPIQNQNGAVVGHLKDANWLGYTYHCIYSDRVEAFVMSTEPFLTSGNAASQKSYVSIIKPVGHFFFKSKGIKFEVTKSFALPNLWVSLGLSVFQLMDGGEALFILNKNKGFCWINLLSEEMECLVEYGRESYCSTDFALSPKVHLVAVPFSVELDPDPITGEVPYHNVVRLYQMTSGQLVGEKTLPGNNQQSWQVGFSQDGRLLRLEGKSQDLVFELQAS